MKKKITILFDMDGTLIDSTEAILEGFNYAFKTNGFEFDDNKKIIKEIGFPLEKMFINLGVHPEEVEKYVAAYKKQYRTISRDKTILLDGVKEAINKAKEFATLGIVTTKSTDGTTLLLENFGIIQEFDVVIGRDSVVNPKPHPEPVLTALKKLEVNNLDKCYMIGDTKMDLISAKEAGINSVGVLCGYKTKGELEKHTNLITSNTLEAVKLISKLENI